MAATRSGLSARQLQVAGGLLALALAYAVAGALAPRGLPVGLLLLGLVFGLINALGAVGLVLVYRAGRYVNFAQGGLGAAGAALAYRLTSAYGWNWFLAVTVGLLVAIALAGLAEVLFVQRLFNAPRLILTVATIGIAQFVAFFELGFNALTPGDVGYIEPKLQPPLEISFRVGGAVFGPAQILVFAVIPLVLLGLALFFVRSRYGAVVQAAAENADRARLLGVSVRSLSTTTWLVVGALSGIAALLQAPVVGVNVGGVGSGPGLLLRALAPAMIAGLTNLPVAVGAALVLGIVEVGLAFNLSQSGPIELVLFVVILAVLLLRRAARGRTTEGEERSFAASTAVRPVPREVASLPVIRIGGMTARAVAVLAALAVPIPLALSGQNLATAIVTFVIAALSITVLTGYAGQVSFGQWAFVGFGALLGGHLATTQDVPFFVGLFAVPLAGALLAVVIGLPALRIRGIFLGVTTLAFAVAASAYVFQLGLFELDGFVDRPGVLADQRNYYYFCVGIVLLCLLGLRNLRTSSLGRAMVAVRDNDRAAASYGVGLITAKLSAFAVSGFLAALAGYLYLFNAGNLDSGSFPPLTSLLLFAAVVIGGLGSPAGAILGALYFRGVSYFLPDYVQFLATSLGLLLILMFLPGGLGSLLFGARDALLRRYANSRGIRVPSLIADTREESLREITAPPDLVPERHDSADEAELSREGVLR